MKVKTSLRAGDFAIANPVIAAFVLKDGTNGCDTCAPVRK